MGLFGKKNKKDEHPETSHYAPIHQAEGNKPYDPSAPYDEPGYSAQSGQTMTSGTGSQRYDQQYTSGYENKPPAEVYEPSGHSSGGQYSTSGADTYKRTSGTTYGAESGGRSGHHHSGTEYGRTQNPAYDSGSTGYGSTTAYGSSGYGGNTTTSGRTGESTAYYGGGRNTERERQPERSRNQGYSERTDTERRHHDTRARRDDDDSTGRYSDNYGSGYGGGGGGGNRGYDGGYKY